MPIYILYYINELNDCSEIIGVYECSQNSLAIKDAIAYMQLYHKTTYTEEDITRENNFVWFHTYLNGPSSPHCI